jgi:hypothetical protein
MPDDRIDWADVAAELALLRGALESGQEVSRPIWDRHIAAALREAHEAGLREASSVPRGGLIAARQDAERRELSALADLDEATAELRALRRELAARRAVDGWLRENGDRYLEVGVLSGRLNACEGLTRLVASAPDYPALAAALGLEVEP